MGGALILIAIAFSTLLWGDLSNRIRLDHADGDAAVSVPSAGSMITARWWRKIPVGCRHAGSISGNRLVAWGRRCMLYYYCQSPVETQLIVPFFKDDYAIEMGLFFIVVYLFRHCRQLQRGQPDRWPGRTWLIMPTVLVAGCIGGVLLPQWPR